MILAKIRVTKLLAGYKTFIPFLFLSSYSLLLPAELPSLPKNKAAASQISIAMGFYRRGFYDLATDEFKRLITKYPSYPKLAQAYFYWAASLKQQKKHGEAAGIFHQLQVKFPQHPLAQKALIEEATIYFEQQEYLKIIVLLGRQKLITELEDPRLRAARLYYLAQSYFKRKDLSKAISTFQQLIDAVPIDSDNVFRHYARLSLAHIHIEQKKIPAAQKLLHSLLSTRTLPKSIKSDVLFQLAKIAGIQEKTQEAIPYYQQLLKEFSDSAHRDQSIVDLSWIYLQGKDYLSVLKLYKQHPMRELNVSSLYIQGQALQKLKRYDDALSYYNMLLQRFPDDDRYRLNAALHQLDCLFTLHRYQQCIQQGQSHIKVWANNPLIAYAYHWIAKSHLHIHPPNPTAAAIVYEDLLSKFFDQWDETAHILETLATLYIQEKQFRKAAFTYRRALDIKGQAPIFYAHALLSAGNSNVEAKEFAEALVDYQNLYTRYPKTDAALHALINTAELKLKLGKNAKEEESIRFYQEATELLGRFIQQFSTHALFPHALYLRSYSHYKLQNWARTIQDARHAIKLAPFPDQNKARSLLAYALWQEQNPNSYEEALKHFAELLDDEAIRQSFSPSLLQTLGEAFTKRHQFQVARNCYQILGKKKNPEIQLNSLIGLGKIALLQKQFEKAIPFFAKAKLQANESSILRPIILTYFAETLRQLGQYDRALNNLEEAEKLGIQKPHEASLLHLAIAQIEFYKKKIDSAERYAMIAAHFYKDQEVNPKALHLLHRIYSEQEKHDKAKEILEELRKRFPSAYKLLHPSTEKNED